MCLPVNWEGKGGELYFNGHGVSVGVESYGEGRSDGYRMIK